MILLNKNLNFNKNETKSKMENPTHSFRETNLVPFSSYKNRKLKVKQPWAGAWKEKKRKFFVPIILSEEIFFKICVLFQCIVHCIHFQNISIYILLHTKKYYFINFCCFFLKSSKAFSVSLRKYENFDI